jgi:hypothetical protein
VADVERIWIKLRFEGDLAAMATSVDLHTWFPVGTRGRVCGQILRTDHNRRCVRRQYLERRSLTLSVLTVEGLGPGDRPRRLLPTLKTKSFRV